MQINNAFCLIFYFWHARMHSLAQIEHQNSGLKVKTTTQQQMTAGRTAPGMSLLASSLLASLKQVALVVGQCAGKADAIASGILALCLQQSCFARHQAFFQVCHGKHPHHIRGGNP
jgi:hypothetical protein